MKRFLVIGDVMRDRYVYVNSSRKAPEAPIPVWDMVSEESRLGGAANVAANLLSMGKNDDVEVYLAGLCGSSVLDMIRSTGINNDLCILDKGMTKIRFVEESNKRIIFRCDDFKSFGGDGAQLMNSFLSSYFSVTNFDAIIISDYDKGTITTDTVKVIERRWPDVLKIVDSKRKDLRLFSGYDVLKVNASEYGAQCSSHDYLCVESLFKYCVVTRGDEGAELRMYDPKRSAGKSYVVHSETFSADPVKAVDVTGCGDTHTAAMAYSLVTEKDIRTAVRFANECARKVVLQFGTSVV